MHIYICHSFVWNQHRTTCISYSLFYYQRIMRKGVPGGRVENPWQRASPLSRRARSAELHKWHNYARRKTHKRLRHQNKTTAPFRKLINFKAAGTHMKNKGSFSCVWSIECKSEREWQSRWINLWAGASGALGGGRRGRRAAGRATASEHQGLAQMEV